MEGKKPNYDLVVNPAAMASSKKKGIYRAPGEGLLGGKVLSVDPVNELKALTESYKAKPRRHTTTLVRGEKSIGKTTLAHSMIKPVLIHSFDPGGTDSIDPEYLKDGRIIVDDRFETTDYDNPESFSMWESVFMTYRKKGVFNKVGTYFLDSLTGWISVTKDHIQFKPPEPGMSTGYSLTKLGWGMLSSVLQIMVRMCNTLPCHVVLSAHQDRFIDEISQTSTLGIAAPPSLQINIPAMFSEYYVLVLDPKDEKDVNGITKRKLLTTTIANVPAGTRIGRFGKFDMFEPPNFKHLLSKVGYATEDLPLFNKPTT